MSSANPVRHNVNEKSSCSYSSVSSSSLVDNDDSAFFDDSFNVLENRYSQQKNAATNKINNNQHLQSSATLTANNSSSSSFPSNCNQLSAPSPSVNNITRPLSSNVSPAASESFSSFNSFSCYFASSSSQSSSVRPAHPHPHRHQHSHSDSHPQSGTVPTTQLAVTSDTPSSCSSSFSIASRSSPAVSRSSGFTILCDYCKVAGHIARNCPQKAWRKRKHDSEMRGNGQKRSKKYWTVYVLKLDQGKYYVGGTREFSERLRKHQNGTATLWTRQYKFVAVEKKFENASKFEEDKQVKEYMDKYGIHNVRGGKYSNPFLFTEQINEIEKDIRHASGQCFNCGDKGHFSKYCPIAKLAATSPTINRRRKQNYSNEQTDSEDEFSEFSESEFSDDDFDDDHYDGKYYYGTGRSWRGYSRPWKHGGYSGGYRSSGYGSYDWSGNYGGYRYRYGYGYGYRSGGYGSGSASSYGYSSRGWGWGGSNYYRGSYRYY